MDFERKLWIQFGKALRHGFANNAKLDPPPTEELTESLVPVIGVVSKLGYQYWFTDRRLLQQIDSEIAELFRYE